MLTSDFISHISSGDYRITMRESLTKNVYNQILSEYNLGELKKSKVFTHGSVQTNVLLQTQKGSVVLRYYKSRSKKSVEFEINLIKFLVKHEFPCPAPIKNKAGKFIGSLENRSYVIFEYIDGVHLKKPSEVQKKQLVQKVAELQNIVGKYCPPNKGSRWNYNVKLCKKLSQSKAKELGTKNAKEKLKWYQAALGNLHLPSNLPKGVCHCDFHFANILFKNSKFKALIDFDDANYTYKIFDLAAIMDPFVSAFNHNTWKKFKKDQNVFNFSETKKIVAHYQKYRPLNDNEKRHLFDVFKLVILIYCLWNFFEGEASDFFERRKIEYLDSLGKEIFYQEIFM